ncbi:hypothetical protein HZS_6626, partial [Henneguya salminicola]
MFRIIFTLGFGYFGILFCCLTISLTIISLVYYNYIPKTYHKIPIFFYLDHQIPENNNKISNYYGVLKTGIPYNIVLEIDVPPYPHSTDHFQILNIYFSLTQNSTVLFETARSKPLPVISSLHSHINIFLNLFRIYRGKYLESYYISIPLGESIVIYRIPYYKLGIRFYFNSVSTVNITCPFTFGIYQANLFIESEPIGI